jgi:hypothetical protein
MKLGDWIPQRLPYGAQQGCKTRCRTEWRKSNLRSISRRSARQRSSSHSLEAALDELLDAAFCFSYNRLQFTAEIQVEGSAGNGLLRRGPLPLAHRGYCRAVCAAHARVLPERHLARLRYPQSSKHPNAVYGIALKGATPPR